VARTIDAKAQTATYSYNARGEQIAVVYINNQRISTEYNALGQATSYQDPTGITTQVFDERGMLSSVEAPSHPSGAALTYGFDALGQRTQMALLAARHTYTFDPIGNLTVYLDPDSRRTTWTYDALGRMNEQRNWNNARTTWTYDGRNSTLQIRHTVSLLSVHGVRRPAIPFGSSRCIIGPRATNIAPVWRAGRAPRGN